MPPVAAPADGAHGGCRQPARGDDRSQAGNGQKAQSGKQAGAAADHTADAGTGRRCGHFMDVGVFFADILVGDEADVAGGNAARFDGGDRSARIGVGIVYATDRCHDWVLW